MVVGVMTRKCGRIEGGRAQRQSSGASARTQAAERCWFEMRKYPTYHILWELHEASHGWIVLARWQPKYGIDDDGSGGGRGSKKMVGQREGRYLLEIRPVLAKSHALHEDAEEASGHDGWLC